MLVFDSRSSKEEPSYDAICCAQLFLLLMEKIRQKHKANASQALAFKLSIHSGDVFETNADSNHELQTSFHMGKTIETSYFLCKQSQPGELIISETTYSQAGGQQRLVAKESREITMPTDNMSFMSYILTADMASSSEILNQQSQQILS